MNNREINDFMKSRMPNVTNALKTIRSELTYEEAEEARQELLLTMYKCILKYNPNRHCTLDHYIIVSMEQRAWRFLRDMRGYSRNKERNTESLSTARDNRTPMIDLLADDSGDFTDKLGANELVEYALGQLDKRTESILRLWANNHTLQYIADIYGKSVHFIDREKDRGLRQMKGIIGGNHE